MLAGVPSPRAHPQQRRCAGGALRTGGADGMDQERCADVDAASSMLEGHLIFGELS